MARPKGVKEVKPRKAGGGRKRIAEKYVERVEENRMSASDRIRVTTAALQEFLQTSVVCMKALTSTLNYADIDRVSEFILAIYTTMATASSRFSASQAVAVASLETETRARMERTVQSRQVPFDEKKM